MSYRSSLALVLTIGCRGRALALGCASSEAADQPSATMVAITGATTTYRSQDRHGKVVTVQIPSQSTTDLKGADAQGNVPTTVPAIDLTRNQVKVQTPAEQTVVVALAPAALTDLQHADLLAQRIQQLGGVPVYSPVEIAAQAATAGVRPEQGPTLREMIIENLMLERQQVAAYTTLIREIGDRDPTTRRLLLEILADTERHASELADYLKSTSEVRA